LKLISRFFYFIAVLIILCCGAVLVCAMSPSLTKSLAGALYGKENVEDSADATGQDMQGLAIGGTGTQNGYVAPSQEDLMLPEQASGKNGLQPLKIAEEEIPAEEAEALANELATGNVGAELSFDKVMYPYYGMLGEELQKLYCQIYANALEGVTAFAPTVEVTTENVRKVFEAVYNDHPELFWVETEYACKYTRDGSCKEICLKYNSTMNSLSDAKQSFQTKVQEIVQEAGKLSDAYAKEKYVHDVLLKTVEYDAAAENGQSAYSALVTGKSVCAGYARAFQYVLQQIGIPCYYCTGYSGADHAWNIVKLGADYYNVDVTWDDTTPAIYDFFNKTDAEYANTHVRQDLSVYLPACRGGLYGTDTEKTTDDTSASEGTTTDGSNDIADTGSDNSIQYINPNPQKPLTLENNFIGTALEREEWENLQKAGITKAEVMNTMEEYYADCLEQMVEVGSGQQYFTNVIPSGLWSSVEQAYGENKHEKGYVNEALKQLKKENFAIQLQLDDIGGGYYRIYHNISTW